LILNLKHKISFPWASFLVNEMSWHNVAAKGENWLFG